MRDLCLLLALSLSACPALGIDATFDGEPLSFAEAVYAERNDLDPGLQVEFHDFRLFLMPFADSCTEMGALLADLAELRTEFGFGMDSTEYCNAWVALWEERTGTSPFAVAQVRMGALPRGAAEEVTTEYGFRDDDTAPPPEAPHFDLDVARYTAPDFEACAAEFEGQEPWAPSVHAATGGSLTVRTWTRDVRVGVRLEADIEGADSTGPASANAAWCPDAWDWPLVFGHGT